MGDRRSYLLVLGEREALAWVLRTSRMAFPPTTRREVDGLAVGDELYLLTTRGCFHNPTRDRTRVIGRATVTTPVVPYEVPVTIAGRDFTRGCDLVVHDLAWYLGGVELGPLVPRLSAFPDKRAWSIRLRRPLLEISSADAALVDRELQEHVRPAAEAVPEYLARIRPVAKQGRRSA